MKLVACISAVVLLTFPVIGHASTLKVVADNTILAEEAARLPPVKPVAVNVSIEINAPEIGTGRKPTTLPVFGLFELEFPAREMLEESSQIEMKRWFVSATGEKSRSIVLTITLRQFDHALISDVGMWRPTTRADLDVTASDPNGKILLQAMFSSDVQLGEWVKSRWGQKFLTKEHLPRYTHMIYRAFLIALDKAMAEVAQRLPATTSESSPPPEQR